MMYYLNVPFKEKDEAKSLGARWDVDEKKWYYTNSADKDKFKKWIDGAKPAVALPKLSDEQQELIRLAKEGKNVLVDACIGSGKTTAIQVLCEELNDKQILYLTYNRLLKIDAQDKITNKRVHVQNYHGFAWERVSNSGERLGVGDLIQTFIKQDPPLGKKYDVLVLDEYQDVEQELAEMLELIKAHNPKMQIIAVGDMKQKIYDKTTLDVPKFIDKFLGEYETLTFTKCFRLGEELASRLGKIWGKEINGVNPDFKVTEMPLGRVYTYLATKDPKDILCLGARVGAMSEVLNALEREYPQKFNKKTVFASISDEDKGAVRPDASTAIFTTFDGSKGLERPICVVFDYTIDYWTTRIEKPMTAYEILRNIFCVAASRGKREIIFVKDGKVGLSDAVLSTPCETKMEFKQPVDMSGMFSFKYKENVEECYNLLKITKKRSKDKDIIDVDNTDELIDLSPCIGIYQEAAYFDYYDLDTEMDLIAQLRGITFKEEDGDTTEEKILKLVAANTGQARYSEQVSVPFVTEAQKKQIAERLSSVFKKDENVQEDCIISFLDEGGAVVNIVGRADVVKDNIVYELKFVSDLSHDNFLQTAAYMVAMRLRKGILWNTRNNEMYEITIPDRKAFLEAMVRCVTKGSTEHYYPLGTDLSKLPRKVKAKPEKSNEELKGKVDIDEVNSLLEDVLSEDMFTAENVLDTSSLDKDWQEQLKKWAEKKADRRTKGEKNDLSI